MQDISEFDKDQLADYAKTVFSVDLDMRKSLDNLKDEVIKLQTKPKPGAVVAPTNPKATHIMNNDNGRIFVYTHELHQYLTNATLCDEAGNPV